MNDVERDLRELLDRKAVSIGTVPSRLPEPVRKRSRRRQLGTALVSGIAAVALVTGSVATLRAFDGGVDRGSVPAEDPWAGYEVFERTATIENFTITSPSDWYLVNQWPLGASLAVSTESGSCEVTLAPGDEGIRASECTDGATSTSPIDPVPPVPILQLSNDDLGLGTSPCATGSFEPTGDDAVLEVAIGPAVNDARTGDQATAASPTWPVRFDEDTTDVGPCGSGHYVRFRVGAYPYVAFASFGPDATENDRRTLFDAFSSMQITEWTGAAPTSPAPGYVIAGGENAAGPWRLELRHQTEPGYIANVELELITSEGRPIRAGGPFVVNVERPIEQAGGDPVFGAVAKEAAGVELRLEPGTPPIPAQIVPLPPSMTFDFDLFFASNDADVQATAVALGLDDATPPTDPSPQLIAKGETVGSSWSLAHHDTPGANRIALVDASGTVLAELDPHQFDSLHASGLEYSSFTFSSGDRHVAVVFGAVAPAATELAIALDIGDGGTLRKGDPRWDPLPVLSSTDEPVLRFWWFETGSGHGQLATFNDRCDRLARTRLETDTPPPSLPSPPPDVELVCGGPPFAGPSD